MTDNANDMGGNQSRRSARLASLRQAAESGEQEQPVGKIFSLSLCDLAAQEWNSSCKYFKRGCAWVF